MPRLPTLTLRKNLSRALQAGHPWLFADALEIPRGLATGAIVDVVDHRGRFLARGLYDAASPLAVRVWTLDPEEAVDERLIHKRVAGARALRRAVIDAETTDAFRLLHGEGDRLPGIVCDVYADTAVIQLDSPAVEPQLEDLSRAVLDAMDGVVRRVVLRPRERARERPTARDMDRPAGRPAERAANRPADRPADHLREPELLAGPPLSGPLVIREHGLRFEVDVARGQKTGFYLDQRENRRRVRGLAAGRRVLNLFAYTGGFSVAAAAGGAIAATSVDISRPAIEAARRNFALNGLDADAEGFAFIHGDVFPFLSRCSDVFDLVVLDPPSMAPSKATLDAALAAYRKLNALALARLAPRGLMLTASCSSHVTADHLRELVGAAAGAAGREVRIVEEAGAGPDHPTLPGFPEGRYLKVLLLFVP